MSNVIEVNFFTRERMPERTREEMIGEAVMYNLAAISVQGSETAPQEEIDSAWEMALGATLELSPEERQEADRQLNSIR